MSIRVLGFVAVFTAMATLNALGIAALFSSDQFGAAPDYQQYVAAVDRALAGEPLYGPEWKWRYAPVAAYLMAPALWPGLLGWSVLHGLALLLVRPPWLMFAMALSWPFWVDVISGNTVTFVAVAGILALRGSTAGTLAYWALCIIIPRPFQLPLALYLLWSRRDLWPHAVAVVATLLGLTLVIGQGPEWILYLVERGAENTGLPFTIHPAAEWGAAWLVVGVPLAILLTVGGWPGLAGIVLSPSLLAQYLLLGFARGRNFLPRGIARMPGSQARRARRGDEPA